MRLVVDSDEFVDEGSVEEDGVTLNDLVALRL